MKVIQIRNWGIFLLLGGSVFISSCKKEEPVPDVPEPTQSEVDVTGTSWSQIEAGYFSNRRVMGIGTIGQNMIVTFVEFSDPSSYRLSGHLTSSTSVTNHSMNLSSGGAGFEKVEVIDGVIYGLGSWATNGLWQFDTDEFSNSSWNSWAPSGAYANPLTALAIYGSERILGSGTAPNVRSASGNISFPGFVATGSVEINDLIIYNGELICAGRFTSSNGTVLNNIAKWNGSEWIPLGTGVNGTVYDLVVLEDQLIVAGKFSEADGNVDCSKVAIWNGSNWEPMETGLIGGFNGVRRLFVYGSQLFVGGDFTGSSSVTSANIIKWKNGNWIALPNTISTPIGEIGMYGDHLYIANGFNISNGNFLMRLQ